MISLWVSCLLKRNTMTCDDAPATQSTRLVAENARYSMANKSSNSVDPLLPDWLEFPLLDAARGFSNSLTVFNLYSICRFTVSVTRGIFANKQTLLASKLFAKQTYQMMHPKILMIRQRVCQTASIECIVNKSSDIPSDDDFRIAHCRTAPFTSIDGPFAFHRGSLLV